MKALFVPFVPFVLFVVKLSAADLGPPPEPVWLSNPKVAALWEWAQAAHTELILLREQAASAPSSPGAPLAPGYYAMNWRFADWDDLEDYDYLYYWEVVQVDKATFDAVPSKRPTAEPIEGPPETPDSSPDPEPVDGQSHFGAVEKVSGGYRVTFPARAAGTYIIEATTRAPNQQSDSFWVTINGAPRIQWNVPLSTGWQPNIVAPAGAAITVGPEPLTILFDQREPTELQAVRLLPAP